MARRMLLLLTVSVGPVALWASAARAQYPGGFGDRGRGGYSQNGIPQTEALPPRADAGPKSEELVDIKPLLRGIKLTTAQDSSLKSINDRYEPQLLPMYDWLRDQRDRRQKGQDVDISLVQKRFDRVMALRQKQLAEIRAVLAPDQLPRWDKNTDDDRRRAAESAPASRAKP